jgi:hypothetical protein
MELKELNKQTLLGIIILLVILSGLFIVINNSKKDYISIDEKVNYRIDSVQYHPMGSDNTLQVTPYWKARLEGTDFFVTCYEKKEKGDSIIMIRRTLVYKNSN